MLPVYMWHNQGQVGHQAANDWLALELRSNPAWVKRDTALHWQLPHSPHLLLGTFGQAKSIVAPQRFPPFVWGQMPHDYNVKKEVFFLSWGDASLPLPCLFKSAA